MSIADRMDSVPMVEYFHSFLQCLRTWPKIIHSDANARLDGTSPLSYTVANELMLPCPPTNGRLAEVTAACRLPAHHDALPVNVRSSVVDMIGARDRTSSGTRCAKPYANQNTAGLNPIASYRHPCSCSMMSVNQTLVTLQILSNAGVGGYCKLQSHDESTNFILRSRSGLDNKHVNFRPSVRIVGGVG